MQASVDIRDIDGIYLYPYYANWVDLEGARIEKAKLNFSSKITGINNDVNAACHLALADIVRRPLAEEEEDIISRIIITHENKEIEMLDLPAASISDTIILVLKKSESGSFDEIIRNCSFFNITKSQVEKILLQLKKEGILYQPKGWMIKLA